MRHLKRSTITVSILAAIAKLDFEKKLSLNDKIIQYLPSLRLHDRPLMIED